MWQVSGCRPPSIRQSVTALVRRGSPLPSGNLASRHAGHKAASALWPASAALGGCCPQASCFVSGYRVMCYALGTFTLDMFIRGSPLYLVLVAFGYAGGAPS